MKHNEYEKVFLISDYIWNVIRGWKVGICFLAVCAALIAGLSYVSAVKDYRTEVSASKKDKDVKNSVDVQLKTLSESERMMVEAANKQVDNVVKQTKYLENAAIMQVDPYDVSRMRITYSVKASAGTTTICRKYSEMIFSDDSIERILEAANGTMKKSDLFEMITTTITNAGKNSSTGEEEGSTVSETQMMLVVNVRALDRETAEKMGTVVEQIIEESQEEVSRMLGSHTLDNLNTYYRGGRESSIVNAQSDANKELYQYNKRIKDLMLTMTDKQKRIVNEYMSIKLYGKEAEDAATAITKPKLSLKRILLGLILGMVLYLGVELIRWQFGGKVNSKEELKQNMELPVLGTIHDPAKPVFFIDKIVENIKNRNQIRPSGDAACEMLTDSIARAASLKGIKSLLITGSGKRDPYTDEVLEKLAKNLTEKGITAKVGDCVLVSAEAAADAAGQDGVILAETVGKSAYQGLVDECTLCSLRDIPILGMILAE